MSAISPSATTSHVKGLADYFSDKAIMGTAKSHLVEELPSDSEVLEALKDKSSFLTPQQKKVIGIALMVLALGLSVIPFTMPLGFGLAIGLTIFSSAISFSGSILYAQGASSSAFLNLKEAKEEAKKYCKSDTVRKVVAVSLMVMSLTLSLVPILKAIEVIGSVVIGGASLLIGELATRLYKKEVHKDEAERVQNKLASLVRRRTIFHRIDNHI